MFRFISVLIATISVWGAWQIISQQFGGDAIAENAPFLVLGAYWFLLRGRLNKPFLKKQFYRHADKDQKVSWKISDERFFGQLANQSSSNFTWETVSEIVEVAEGFLVVRIPIYYLLPLISFSNEEDITWFRTFAKTKLKNNFKLM